MTDLLNKALSRVSRLPAEKQDFMAEIILREIDGDEKRDGLISDPRSQTLLEHLVGRSFGSSAAIQNC